MDFWPECCDKYIAFREELFSTGKVNQEDVITPLIPAMVERFGDLSTTEVHWFREALADEKKKWFVDSIVEHAGTVPATLFQDMIRAGVYEVNPSTNRSFIESCLKQFGHRKVNEALLEFVEHGSNFEKAGAVNALYWAQSQLLFKSTVTDYRAENATPESKAAYDAVADLSQRKRELLLKEFIANPDVNVRRSIVPHLKLDPAQYPDELKPMIIEAIEIARGHPDEYIRHRIEVQLGNEQTMKPLPYRSQSE